LLLAAIVSVMHGVELLELVGCEDGGELLAGLLVDCFQLLLHGFGGDRGVLFQGGDFVVAVGEDRFEFRGLIGERLSFLLSFAASRWGVVGMVVLGPGSGGGVLLLTEGKTAGKGQG
jgi:hypothetical protein